MSDQQVPDQGEIARQMRLRPAPPPVTRLSRKALMAIGGVASLALAGALGFALVQQPHRADKPELYRVGGTPPETVQALPVDYATRAGSGSAPLLGPPLPGDLGRPILAARQAGVDVTAPSMGVDPATSSATPSAPDMARQQAARERDSARTSGLFLTDAGRRVSSPPSGVPAGASGSVAGQGGAGTSTTPALGPVPPPYTLQAGTIIPGALITGLRSDLPGAAIGQVTDDVYDSVSGRHLLVPKGSRLLGAYRTDVGFGQSRLALVWTRLILPNGRAINLEDARAIDAQGFSGLEDRTDSRWGERLRTAALTTVLAVGSSAGVSSGEDAVARALTQGVSGGVNAFGQGLVGKSLDVAPRLTVRPGFVFRLIVTHDLALEPYGEIR
jgi:type IV secretion system protein VirB10